MVLENETFSTPCEGETPPTPSPTRSLRSLICVAPSLLNMLLRPCTMPDLCLKVVHLPKPCALFVTSSGNTPENYCSSNRLCPCL